MDRLFIQYDADGKEVARLTLGDDTATHPNIAAMTEIPLAETIDVGDTEGN